MKVVDTGLYNKLAGDSTLMALCSGGTPVFQWRAPPDTARPYVVFFFAGGGTENVNPSDLTNFRYAVKGVSDTLEAAANIKARVRTVLHKQTLTVTGYTNFDTAEENEVRMVEDAPDGNPIYHYGAYYRIRLDD